MKNAYYFAVINSIGGIETFFYYLAKKYKDKDITIYYKSADEKQLKRLKKYVRCIKYQEGMKIKCDRMFFNFNMEIIDNVEAKDYILVIHGDYKDMIKRKQLSSPPYNKKITRVIGVSQIACDSYKELTGIDCELCYNPFMPDEPQRVLKLISATRLSIEKGRERMLKMIQKLDEAGIPYIWNIFTNSKNTINSPNVCYLEPRLDILNYIADSDALVQLSDNEGYCYSVTEALNLNKPVIVTKCPVFDELGLDNTNSIKLDFDMQNLNVYELYDKILSMKVNYKPKEDNWNKLLLEGKSTYKEERDMKFKVRALETFVNTIDKDVNRFRTLGEEWEVSKERLDVLLGQNKNKIVYVENLGEVKEEPIEPVKYKNICDRKERTTKEVKKTTKKTTKTK